MSAKALMLMGGLCGVVFAATWIVLPDAINPMLPFAAGALFGKGYGVWETRRALAPGKDRPEP